MTRKIETALGVALILVAVFLLVAGDHKYSDWFYLALVGAGGLFIDRELTHHAGDLIVRFLPWRKSDEENHRD